MDKAKLLASLAEPLEWVWCDSWFIDGGYWVHPETGDRMDPTEDYGQALQLAERERIWVSPSLDSDDLWNASYKHDMTYIEYEDIRMAICLAVAAKYGVEI